MTFRSNLAKATLASAAAAAVLTGVSVPSLASAQPYGSSYYDPCRRDQTNRGTAGALIGGALGAAIGSNAAARKNRTEGALLGGAVGAVAGATVGNNSAACRSGYDQGYYGSGYDRGYSGDYNNGAYNQGAYSQGAYNNGYYNNGYYGRPYDLEDRYQGGGYYSGGYTAYDDGEDDDYGYAYGFGGERLRITQRVGSDGCTLAESPVYMPDGRTVTRMVRVCRDSRGRYQVVD